MIVVKIQCLTAPENVFVTIPVETQGGNSISNGVLRQSIVLNEHFLTFFTAPENVSTNLGTARSGRIDFS